LPKRRKLVKPQPVAKDAGEQFQYVQLRREKAKVAEGWM